MKTLQNVLNNSTVTINCPIFLLAYKSAVHEITGYSPSQRLFGCDFRLPSDLLFSRPPDAPLAPEEYIEKLKACMEEMHHLKVVDISINMTLDDTRGYISGGFCRTYEQECQPHPLFEKESDGGELSCSNSDADEDVGLNESDCEESEESADIVDNIPVNPDVYVSRDST
ncbi:retrovirus-related Pol polyprotein from transposon 412 [Trichonephila clavipes]|nr:retrovirus-related Pol polyprotein from transposon 412 [Trichonephila clavipes]